MPIPKRKIDAERTWTIQVRVPSDIPIHRAGRWMARLLKYLLRTWGVRCIAVRDSEPAERVES
jgi:hypothetical protein